MEKEISQKISIRVIGLAILLLIVCSPLGIVVRWNSGQDAGMFGGSGTELNNAPYSVIFLLMLIMAFISKKSKLRLKPEEFGILMGVLYFMSNIWRCRWQAAFWDSLVIGNTLKSDYLKLIPGWMYTVDPGAWTGGAPVPWGQALPVVYLWIFYQAIIVDGLIILGATLLWKKFIEIDKLPFPGFMPGITLIKLYQKEEDSKPLLLKHKYFWIGWLLGALWAFPSSINYFYPIWPATHVFGRIPLTPYLEPIFRPFHIQGWWFIDLNMIPFYSLMPTDVLLTMIVIDFIVYWLYPAVGVMTGAVSPGISMWSYYWGRTTGGIAWLAFCFYGCVVLGIGLWVVITGWKYFKESLSRAIKGVVESPDDVPDRWIWGGLIILSLLYIIFWTVAGAPPLISIWFLILYFLGSIIGSTWVWSQNLLWQAEPLNWYGDKYIWGLGNILGLYPNPSATTQSAMSRAIRFSLGYTESQWNGVGGILYGYRLKDVAGNSPKTTFLTYIIVLVVMAIIAPFIALPMLHTYGASVVFKKGYSILSSGQGPGVTTPMSWHNPWQIAWAIAGVISPFIVMPLRMRFPWFFLNPAGFLIWPVSHGIIHMGPALLIKLGVLKIGGAKGYENVWVPIAIGIVVGAVTIGFFGYWALTLKTLF